MNLSGNTILITGGTSGIGFELAAQFLAFGNTVIVTGRSRDHLDATKRQLPAIHAVESDVGDPAAISALHHQVVKQFPAVNVLVNNAGVMRKIDLHAAGSDLEDVTREIEIDLNGAIRMVVQFLPLLERQPRAAIVNVSSGLAFVPLAISPIYCAAKAALHSFTQSLRIQLKNTHVAVFELAPPITATSLFKGDMRADDAGVRPMDVKILVRHAIAGMARDRLEIRPGLSNVLKIMSRLAPDFMARQLSKPVDRMLTQSRERHAA